MLLDGATLEPLAKKQINSGISDLAIGTRIPDVSGDGIDELIVVNRNGGAFTIIDPSNVNCVATGQFRHEMPGDIWIDAILSWVDACTRKTLVCIAMRGRLDNEAGAGLMVIDLHDNACLASAVLPRGTYACGETMAFFPPAGPSALAPTVALEVAGAKLDSPPRLFAWEPIPDGALTEILFPPGVLGRPGAICAIPSTRGKLLAVSVLRSGPDHAEGRASAVRVLDLARIPTTGRR